MAEHAPQPGPRGPSGAHAPPAMDDTPDLRVGTHVGNYVIHERLGRGGMALVYRATHTRFHEEAAVKLLHPRHGAASEMRRRFLREARAMREISKRNRHVVRALDFGETERGEAYLVMEYLRGQDLHQLLKTTGPLDWSRAAPLALQLCDALASTHAVGLLHRDIKPSNCFLADQSQHAGPIIKLIDFGIAKDLGESGEQTDRNIVLGTPAYLAPELLALGAPPDARSDIYALGATIYCLLTGAPPYQGQPRELLQQQHQPLPPPSARRPADLPPLPPGVDELVLRAVHLDPEQRFQSAGTLADAIRHTQYLAPDADPPTAIHVPRPRRRDGSPDLLLRALIIVTVLVSAGIAAVAWFALQPPPAPAPVVLAPGACDPNRGDEDCGDDEWCIRGACRPRPPVEYAARGESCRERDCEPPHLECGPDLVCFRTGGERPPAPHCEDPRVVAAVEALVQKCNQRQHDITALAQDPMNCSGDVWRDLTASDAEIDLLLSAFPDRFAVSFPRAQPRLRGGWPDAEAESFLRAQIAPHLARIGQAHRIFVIGRASPDGPADSNYALSLRRIDVFERLITRMLQTLPPEPSPTPDPAPRPGPRFVSWGVADDRLLTLASFTRNYVGSHPPFAFTSDEQSRLRAGVDRFSHGDPLAPRELRDLEQAVNRVVLVIPILCDPRRL
ncbi:MAG: serine/threonine protein kinase [Myxococcales bacterium]|nr:serine/threonine protein kinase [Myxococcales bacterium]